MAVAEAIGDAEKTIEQIMTDAVSPELRAWLKEQEPKTAEKLGNLANLLVESRNGPPVGGKYVTNRGGRKSEEKERFGGNALKSHHLLLNKRVQDLK